MSMRDPKGRWTKYHNEWQIISEEHDWGQDLEVTIETKSGKEHKVIIIKKIGDNEYGSIYSWKWPAPKGHAKWVARDGSFCISAPEDCKKGDKVNILKKDGTLAEGVLNVHIEDHYWYLESQKGQCSACAEDGPCGELCQLCNEGHYESWIDD